MKQSEVILDDFTKSGAGLSSRKTFSGRKARLVQTFMTDAEFAENNIAVLPPSYKEGAGKWLMSEHGEVSYNAPVLHCINLFKSEEFAIDRTTTRPKAKPKDALPLQLVDRMAKLRKISAEEGVSLNEDSFLRAEKFLKSLEFSARPSLFLAGNGNLRAVWRNQKGEQAAFQFKSTKDEIQYVIFRVVDGSREQILGSMSFRSMYDFLRNLKTVRGLLSGRAVDGE